MCSNWEKHTQNCLLPIFQFAFLFLKCNYLFQVRSEYRIVFEDFYWRYNVFIFAQTLKNCNKIQNLWLKAFFLEQRNRRKDNIFSKLEVSKVTLPLPIWEPSINLPATFYFLLYPWAFEWACMHLSMNNWLILLYLIVKKIHRILNPKYMATMTWTHSCSKQSTIYNPCWPLD